MNVIAQVNEGESFRLDVSRHEERVIIEARGELDMETGPALEQELLAAEASDASRIVLDLSGLGFIDSTGLMAVLNAVRRSAADRNRLRIIRGDGCVADMVRLTGIDQVVNFLD